MVNQRINKEKKSGGMSFPIKKISIGLIFVILIFVLLFFLYPQFSRSLAFKALRIKNAFSHYILQHKPQFYYLEMEKNGKDIRVDRGEALEVTYRDEFVVKSVASDDLTGKHITVKVEGLSKENNDLGVLLKGIDLVNKIKSGNEVDNSSVLSAYKIIINYRGEMIAAVPLKIVITPQDWFRFAKDSSSVKEQIEYLKKAIVLNKNDISVRKILAGIYLRQGRLDNAISLYKDVLDIKPDDSATREELAKCYIKKNDFDNAVKISKEMIKINPKESQAYVILALSLAEKGLWDQAIQNYRQAVRLNPDNYLVRFKLAETYRKNNMINSAIDEYKYIAEHSQDADRALLPLGDMYLKLKKYAAAVECYKEVIKRQPRLVAAYANLASAYAGLDKWPEELDNLKKAVTLNPNNPVIRFNMGAAYERKKMDDEATKEYEQALKVNPEDADALERLADLALKGKKYVPAIKYYQKLAAKVSNKSSIYANLGFAYGELKDYAASAENYEKAIKYGAKSSNMHYNLAYTYDKLGKEKKAIAEYEKILPPTREVLEILAHFYLKEKKCAVAITYYKQIARLEPKKSGSYGSLGYAYAACNDLDRAIQNYRIALKYDRDDDEIYANMGETYEKKGRYQEALKAYTSAYALNPESAQAGQRIPKLKIKLLQEKAQKKIRSEE
jgi:tetratricopeptide (TPR) repeat protein